MISNLYRMVFQGIGHQNLIDFGDIIPIKQRPLSDQESFLSNDALEASGL